jgi:hypothetical protein
LAVFSSFLLGDAGGEAGAAKLTAVVGAVGAGAADANALELVALMSRAAHSVDVKAVVSTEVAVSPQPTPRSLL